ncbi:hypothetical protein Nepgr_010363 [Nepenthes gracilis]|uniref:HR-like lesion-inducer n=1 Tax=Nepenthes gracilis TaxID=150966 RepID=A0AAD3SC35_NEPGR|nr:hypothetical protein Nepgr_010363 [Nepenthes gracilis]
MGFMSFLGRVLFASIFILSAWQMFNEFGVDGGPAAKELVPRFSAIQEHLALKFGVRLPDTDAKRLVATSILVKGTGGALFVFGSTFGVYLLLLYLAFTTPVLYDFYNYDFSHPEFFGLLNDFLQGMALFGALLFFLGMKNSIPKRLLQRKAPKTKTN